jgi:hypothetical protein
MADITVSSKYDDATYPFYSGKPGLSQETYEVTWHSGKKRCLVSFDLITNVEVAFPDGFCVIVTGTSVDNAADGKRCFQHSSGFSVEQLILPINHPSNAQSITDIAIHAASLASKAWRMTGRPALVRAIERSSVFPTEICQIIADNLEFPSESAYLTSSRVDADCSSFIRISPTAKVTTRTVPREFRCPAVVINESEGIGTYLGFNSAGIQIEVKIAGKFVLYDDECIDIAITPNDPNIPDGDANMVVFDDDTNLVVFDGKEAKMVAHSRPLDRNAEPSMGYTLGRRHVQEILEVFATCDLDNMPDLYGLAGAGNSQ